MTRWLRVALVFLFAFGVVTGVFAQTTGINDQEIQRFVLPGTNTTGWRAHANSSHMHLTLPRGNIIARGGYKTPYSFSHGGRTVASVTNVAMPIAGTAGERAGSTTSGISYQRAHYAGSIIGVAIGSSAALTAGTATCEPTILQADGSTVTATGLTVALGGPSPTTYNSTTQERGLDLFTSTAGIGARLTTSAAFAPSTAELVCTVMTEQ